MVDATLIAAPSSTKNQSGERDPEMHQTKKGNQWHFGMKAHIGVDADSGLVHTVVGTAANVNDVTQAHALVHGEETDVFADAGYQGVGKRDDRFCFFRLHRGHHRAAHRLHDGKLCRKRGQVSVLQRIPDSGRYGKVTRFQAEQKAVAEYEKFNKQQRIESDFDRTVKKLLKRKDAEE